MKQETIKLTKSALSKLILWSTSRHNEQRKPAAVKEIYQGMIDGGVWVYRVENDHSWVKYLSTEREYSSGSFCEGSNMSRTKTYKVDYEAKTIFCVEDDTTYNVLIKKLSK